MNPKDEIWEWVWSCLLLECMLSPLPIRNGTLVNHGTQWNRSQAVTCG